MDAERYISKILADRRDVFREIYRFNTDIIGYISPDCLPKDVTLELLKKLSSSERYEEQVSAYVKNAVGIHDFGYYNFSDERYFLCLFSAEEISKIICYIGGICFSEQIRKTILNHELLNLKRAIGEDAYHFSMRSASLFLRNGVAESWQCDGKTLVEKIYNTGKSLLENFLSDFPKELLTRFVLKFPKTFKWDFSKKRHIDSNFSFIKKIVKRAIPSSDNIAVSIIKM